MMAAQHASCSRVLWLICVVNASGKTTAAKKMARLMRDKGLLPTDKCIEVRLSECLN